MSKEQSYVLKAWEVTLRKTQQAKKRANSVFGTVSVAPHTDHDVTSDENDDETTTNRNSLEEFYHAERVLPNGDYYTGQWYDNFPHGQGKYLWTDGCMYIGEWYNGKTMGHGKFGWPYGATYEGEFKSGYMDGIGTYTGPSGDAYKGQWVMNLKHGHGVKSFANGDAYDGEWRRGLQEGQGKYQWSDGCHYTGEWKNDPADYMLSICGDDALRELSSPGKSGSFFYLTNDDRYMIKTMKKSETKVLLRMLAAYYNHVRAFENSLVIRFFGLHCVKLNGPTQKKVRFVIMGNLFCSKYSVHRRFDLKGSSLGRTTDKPESEIDSNTILKDQDLGFIFRLQKAWYQEFIRQIDKDCEFLEQERIMDYSLLVGIHFREASVAGELIPSGAQTPIGESEEDAGHRLSRSEVDDLLSEPSRWASIRLGTNMPARAERTMRKNDSELELVGEPTGEFYDVVMIFGIIDILQDYDISKKLEHAYKSIQYDPTSISAVDPRLYSRRFRDFIFKVFTDDN
ncbi:hypothetical protein DY000_02028450 [Brassica cretica]|uniref:1-phosphatidylinositol-4-phosphate 5-kinase n=1 Tax=Brassica cretica TaxID=69181 RepID=A0ABQ7DCR4_BRACR|nr:hypothetical protein DY000_02028450 [Brassica cretica]